MEPSALTPAWHRLRRHPAAWALAGLALLVGILVARDIGRCWIVVYNQTASVRENVQVRIGPAVFHFERLEPGESRRVFIPPGTAAGPVRVAWENHAAEAAVAEFVPAAGRQLVLRLEAGDHVFAAEQESVWRQLGIR